MEKKVIDYRIVTDNLEANVEREVNRLLIEGWELHGYSTYNDLKFCQAMILKEE
jgi:hypothetical protein